MTDERFKEIQATPIVRDSILLKLEHIRRYLNSGKSSIMIGAGFSKNAKKAPSVNVKDWNALTEDFLDRIYTKEERKNLNLRFVSPLRIASQIEASYGRHELEDIIKCAVPDESLTPGILHEELVSLPWKDIFTMNYDTLIERAAKAVGKKYEVVTTRETLYYQSSGRIVKLHGSHPNARPYIITEEDYRCYKEEYPEFVNTVRQALLETVFCLIGFSGEDPNFLEWLGWVRDIMGTRMSPVYMFSTQSQRINESELALLGSRGITVIQRPEFLSIDEFFEFIFKFLSVKPSETKWSLNQSIKSLGHGIKFENDKEVEKVIKILRTKRESYPGWLLLREDRMNKFDIYSPKRDICELSNHIKEIRNEELLLKYLYEIDWVFRKNFSPLFIEDWYGETLKRFVSEEWLSQNNYFQYVSSLAISLYQTYRLFFNHGKASEIENLINKYSYKLDLEELNRFKYEQCLYRLPLLRYDEIYNIIEEWEPTSEDYQGIILKAAILNEIGERDQAISLLIMSRQQAKKAMLSKEFPNLEESAVAIIECILRSYPDNMRLRGINEGNTDNPYNFYRYANYYSERIRASIQDNKFRNSSVSRVHNFNLEHVTKSYSMGDSKEDEELWFASSMLLFWEAYGFPFGFREYGINTDLLCLCLRTALSRQLQPFGIQYLIRSGNVDVLHKVLTREKICFLSREFIEYYANLLIDIWEEKFSRADSFSNLEWRYKNVGIILLTRFTIFTSQEIITKIVDILLKLFQCGFYGYKGEYLRCALNSQELSFLVKSVEKCLEIKLLDQYSHLPFQVPVYRYIDYNASDIAVSIVLEGLCSEDKQIAEAAYIRCARHFNAFSKNKNIDKLKNAIVNWRNHFIGVKANAIYSFNLVKYGSTTVEERFTIESIIEEAFSKYQKSGIIDSEKVTHTEFSDLIEIVVPLGKYISSDKVELFLHFVIDFLKVKENAFRKEWEGRLPIMFRDHLLTVMEEITKAVTSVPYQLADPDLLSELQDIVMVYIGMGLPFVSLMVKLNDVTKHYSENKLKDFIWDCITTENEYVQGDAISSISSSMSPAIKSIWKKIIVSLQYMETKDLTVFLPALYNLCITQKIKPTDLNIPYAMEGVRRNLFRKMAWKGDEFDVQYRIMEILGYYNYLPPTQFSRLAGKWIEDIEDEETPNDVRRGFEEGKAVYNTDLIGETEPKE